MAIVISVARELVPRGSLSRVQASVNGKVHLPTGLYCACPVFSGGQFHILLSLLCGVAFLRL